MIYKINKKLLLEEGFLILEESLKNNLAALSKAVKNRKDRKKSMSKLSKFDQERFGGYWKKRRESSKPKETYVKKNVSKVSSDQEAIERGSKAMTKHVFNGVPYKMLTPSERDDYKKFRKSESETTKEKYVKKDPTSSQHYERNKKVRAQVDAKDDKNKKTSSKYELMTSNRAVQGGIPGLGKNN